MLQQQHVDDGGGAPQGSVPSENLLLEVIREILMVDRKTDEQAGTAPAASKEAGWFHRVPSFLFSIAFVLGMVLVVYGAVVGAKVKLYPPEIDFSVIKPKEVKPCCGETCPSRDPCFEQVSDLREGKVLTVTGDLSAESSVHVAPFLVSKGSAIIVQPQQAAHQDLYFNLAVRSPSGLVKSGGKYRSTKDSSPFSTTATESGLHLLIVSLRSDDGEKSGPFVLTVAQP